MRSRPFGILSPKPDQLDRSVQTDALSTFYSLGLRTERRLASKVKPTTCLEVA